MPTHDDGEEKRGQGQATACSQTSWLESIVRTKQGGHHELSDMLENKIGAMRKEERAGSGRVRQRRDNLAIWMSRRNVMG